MRSFGSGISTLPGAWDAACEAAALVRAGLGGVRPDLAVIFATPDLMEDAARIAAAVHEELGPVHLIGCSAEAVIGTGREVERGPALSLWAAALPGASIESFALEPGRATDGGTVMVGWPPGLDPAAPPEFANDSMVILLADPFTFPPEALAGHGGGPTAQVVVGGMASGGRAPGEHRLILGHDVLAVGAVGVGVTGVVPVVSQGCRPVGPEMTVTAAEGTVIAELAGRPALERVREVAEGLSPEDRLLVEDGVLAGLVIQENRPDHRQGDFLIRGILGADPETGSIMVGEQVRVGQTVQLQVRDAGSADDDLRGALADVRSGLGDAAPGGALVFSCNGRGTRMFPEPHHDAQAVREVLGEIPVGGIFCNGEIGPVGGHTHVHAFTATLAVFPA